MGKSRKSARKCGSAEMPVRVGKMGGHREILPTAILLGNQLDNSLYDRRCKCATALAKLQKLRKRLRRFKWGAFAICGWNYWHQFSVTIALTCLFSNVYVNFLSESILARAGGIIAFLAAFRKSLSFHYLRFPIPH
jgi:hypothetical protein